MKLLKRSELKKTLSSGFTLIELLVVIGVLGILAAALLATIDPIEQFRKAGDGNAKTVASELVGAINRYFATRQVYPWQAAGVGGDGCNGSTAPSNVAAGPASAPFFNCITALINAGELKPSFGAVSNQNLLTLTFVTLNAAGELTSCFRPNSKAERLSPLTLYNSNGTLNTPACDVGSATKATSLCHWCAR